MTRCDSENKHPPQGLGWRAPTTVRADIVTPRLTIRPYELSDAQSVHTAVKANLGHLLPWMPWARTDHTTLAGTTRYIADQILALDAGTKFTNIGLPIFETATGTFVGATGIHDTRPDTASAETGYWIAKSHIGRGYATEACRHLISWALSPQSECGMGLERIRIYCSDANTPSAQIPERLGLTAEVRQRRDYFIEGIGPTDRLGWGVLKDEWDCDTHAIKG